MSCGVKSTMYIHCAEVIPEGHQRSVSDAKWKGEENRQWAGYVNSQRDVNRSLSLFYRLKFNSKTWILQH
jgi:hypothetical protein